MSHPRCSFYVPSLKEFCLFYNECAKIAKINFSMKQIYTSGDY